MLGLLIALMRRKPKDLIARLQDNFVDLMNKQQRLEDIVRDEIISNRQETAQSAQQARQELIATLKLSSDSLQQRLAENIGAQKDQLDSFSKQLMALARLNELWADLRRRVEERLERELERMWREFWEGVAQQCCGASALAPVALLVGK